MQTEIMKENKFYQVGAIMLYSSFQQSNLIFAPISAFDTLRTQEFTKSHTSWNCLVKDIFYCNHIPRSMGKNLMHVTSVTDLPETF